MHGDMFVVASFLLFTLFVGICYGRGIKSFRAYAVGNKQIGTWILVTSMVTTYCNADMLSSLSLWYQDGLWELIRTLAYACCYMLFAYFFLVRMREFMGDLSISESLGKLYGPVVQRMASAWYIVAAVSIVAAQLSFGKKIFEAMYPQGEAYVSYSFVALIVILVLVYSLFGGAKAVVATDFYQFLFFGLALPLVLYNLVSHVSNWSEGWKTVTSLPNFNYKTAFSKENIPIKISWTLLNLLVFSFNPALTQRIYMAGSIRRAKCLMYRSAAVYTIVCLMFCAIAYTMHLSGHVLESGQSVVGYILQLDYFPYMRGIIASSMLALLVSTLDSALHVASVYVVNDFFPNLKQADAHASKALRLTRIASVVICMLGFYIAMHTNSLHQLSRKTQGLYKGIGIIFGMSILGFRPRPAAAVLTLLFSVAQGLYNIVALPVVYGSTVAMSLLYTLVCFILVHYLLPKLPNTGWVGIKNRTALDIQNQETAFWWSKLRQHLCNLYTVQYWQQLFPQTRVSFLMLGLYLIAATTGMLFYLDQRTFPFASYAYAYVFVLFVGTFLATYPTLHAYKPGGNRYMHVLWPFILFWTLFIAPRIFLIRANYQASAYCIYLLSFGVGFMVLPGGLAVLALLLAYYSVQEVGGSLGTAACAWSAAEWVSVVISSMSSALLLLYYKYVTQKQLKREVRWQSVSALEKAAALEAIHNQAYYQRLHANVRTPILEALDHIDYIFAQETKMPAILAHWKTERGQLMALAAFVEKTNFEQNFRIELSNKKSNQVHESGVQPIAIAPFLSTLYGFFKGLDLPQWLLVQNHSQCTQFEGSETKLMRIFQASLIGLARSYGVKPGLITLGVTDTQLHYYNYQLEPGGMTQQRRLPALAFYLYTEDKQPLITPLYTFPLDNLPDTGHIHSIDELYKQESQRIVYAHRGYWAIEADAQGGYCLYVLPLHPLELVSLKTYQGEDLLLEEAQTEASCQAEQALLAHIRAHQSVSNLSEAEMAKALSFIKKAHFNQLRKTGEPYYTHPMAVATLVMQKTVDRAAILAALLHDVVEDTCYTLDYITVVFGEEVAGLVSSVTHYAFGTYPLRLSKAEQHAKITHAKDPRVFLIKLADRVHNVHTLYGRSPKAQVRIAQETLDFFIPLARQRGFTLWADELQDICQSILVGKL